jgi:small-conductance mechanosensitive channel/CRP-like cAMP-binding protein
VGVAVALVLLLAARAFLRKEAQGSVRPPGIFLALHLMAQLLLRVLPEHEPSARATTLVSVVLLFASIGRSAVLLGLDVVLGSRLARPLPRIFRDIIQGAVYIVLFLVALRTAGVEPGSILTTSALLTAAIALSLQETLGNLVAGLAIQAQRPFDVDDWIQFDGEQKHIGKVLEINWRATKLLTLDDVEVVVPNATLAKAPITNFTKPTRASRRSLYVQVPAEIPPHAVRSAVMLGLPGALGVLASPAPSVVLNAFVDGNIEYWIRYWTEDFHMRDAVDSAARERVWYSFARANIPVAAPNRSVTLEEVSVETRARDENMRTKGRAEALAKVDFLRVLSEEQRHRLAEASRIHVYGPGERIVIEGEATTEMFIVKRGTVSILRGKDGSPAHVATLGPGEFFGEMALMTGELRNATVRAEMPTKLISVDHAAIKTVLEEAPELATLISRVISERQAEHAAKSIGKQEAASVVEEQSSQLVGRIKKFFAL